VRDAATNTELLSSENPSIAAAAALPMIQQLDPPRHDALRDLLWRAFTPRRVAAMEPRIREFARGLLARMVKQGRADLLRDYAAQLPSLVIGELIGIPPERRELFLEWSEAIILAQVPGREPPYNPFEKIYGEFAALLAQRSSEARDDLISALIDAEQDGRKLTREELLGFCAILVVGGNDTTANLIGNGAVLLAKHPEQRAELVANPALIPAAVEEMLRDDSPTQVLGRTATRDSELQGKTVHKVGLGARLSRGARALLNPIATGAA
jgi:cytochrome P450